MGLQRRSAGEGGFVITHSCGCVAVKWTEGLRDTEDGEFIGLSGKKRKLPPAEFLGSAMDTHVDIHAIPWDARKGVEAELEEEPTLGMHLSLVSPPGWYRGDGVMIG